RNSAVRRIDDERGATPGRELFRRGINPESVVLLAANTLLVLGVLLSDDLGIAIVGRRLTLVVRKSLRELLIRQELAVPGFLRPLQRGRRLRHQPFALQVGIAPGRASRRP